MKLSRTMQIFRFIGIFSVFSSASALANNTDNNVLNMQNQALNQQNIAVNRLNQQQLQSRAQEWGLTEQDLQRYQSLMEGERGVWSPNLDPLTVLGIEARNEQERSHYARLLAKKMYERVEKELAFQRAYDTEFAKLYPNQLPFAVEPHIAQSVGRVIYFTRLDNCEKCESDASRILAHVDNNTPIDIYFVGTRDNDQLIYDWAKKNKVDPQKVNQKMITLNHDQGRWLQYAGGKMPVAFQIQGDGQWQRLVY